MLITAGTSLQENGQSANTPNKKLQEQENNTTDVEMTTFKTYEANNSVSAQENQNKLSNLD